MLLDEAIRAVLRDEMRTVVREELRSALDEIRTTARAASEEFLSVKEAATIAGVCPATVRGWLRQGQLRRYGTARLPRIRRVDLMQFLASEAQSRPDRPRSLEEQADAIVQRCRG